MYKKERSDEMDYELMMNGNVKVGELAPDFTVKTTMGEIKLNSIKEKKLILFSYPGDFNPVCTDEIIEFSKLNDEFMKRNTYLIGLSTDSISSHIAWLNDIYNRTGIKVPFPIISDRNGEIARKYGMISSTISNSETIRNVYIIDELGKIVAILSYPNQIKRNIYEILRIIDNLN